MAVGYTKNTPTINCKKRHPERRVEKKQNAWMLKMDKANQISGVEQAGPPEDGCSTSVARDELKKSNDR